MKLNLDIIALIMQWLDKKAQLNILMQTCKDIYSLGLPILLAHYEEQADMAKATNFLRHLLVQSDRRVPCVRSLQLPSFNKIDAHKAHKEDLMQYTLCLGDVLHRAANLKRLALDLSYFPDLDMADLLPLHESCKLLTDLSLRGVSVSTMIALLPSSSFPLRMLHLQTESSSHFTLDVLLRPFSETLETIQLEAGIWSISHSGGKMWPCVRNLTASTPPESGNLSITFPHLDHLTIRTDASARGTTVRQEHGWKALTSAAVPTKVLRKVLQGTAVHQLEILDEFPVDDRVADALARVKPLTLKVMTVAEEISVIPHLLPLSVVATSLERLRLRLRVTHHATGDGSARDVQDLLLEVIVPLTELVELELDYSEGYRRREETWGLGHAFHLRLAWHMPALQRVSHTHNGNERTCWVVVRGFQKGKPTVELEEIEDEVWASAGFGWDAT